jgi:hypothetical protein
MKVKTSIVCPNLVASRFTGIIEVCDGSMRFGDRNVAFISYWSNGIFHRENGPAIYYIWNNEEIRSGYYLNNNHYANKENFEEAKENGIHILSRE